MRGFFVYRLSPWNGELSKIAPPRHRPSPRGRGSGAGRTCGGNGGTERSSLILRRTRSNSRRARVGTGRPSTPLTRGSGNSLGSVVSRSPSRVSAPSRWRQRDVMVAPCLAGGPRSDHGGTAAAAPTAGVTSPPPAGAFPGALRPSAKQFDLLAAPRECRTRSDTHCTGARPIRPASGNLRASIYPDRGRHWLSHPSSGGGSSGVACSPKRARRSTPIPVMW